MAVEIAFDLGEPWKSQKAMLPRKVKAKDCGSLPSSQRHKRATSLEYSFNAERGSNCQAFSKVASAYSKNYRRSLIKWIVFSRKVRIMSELSFNFDDVEPNESISQINAYEKLADSDKDDGDDHEDPPVSKLPTSAQPPHSKFPKNTGPSAYLLVNDDNIAEATKLLKVYVIESTLTLL